MSSLVFQTEAAVYLQVEQVESTRVLCASAVCIELLVMCLTYLSLVMSLLIVNVVDIFITLFSTSASFVLLFLCVKANLSSGQGIPLDRNEIKLYTYSEAFQF